MARERGVHDAVHQRLMHGYWADDADISDADVLVGLSSELDPDEVRDAAATHPYQQRIDELTGAVFEMGANGVPAFAIDDRVLIPGAQPHSLFVKVMDRLGHESVEITDEGDGTES